MKSYVRSIE